MCLQIKHKEEVDYLQEKIYRLQVETYGLLSLTSVSHCHSTLTLCVLLFFHKKCLQAELATFRSENEALQVFYSNRCILATPQLLQFLCIVLSAIKTCICRSVSGESDIVARHCNRSWLRLM